MRCPKNRFANLPFSTSCGAADGVHGVTKTETVARSSCTLPDPQVLALVSVNPWLSGAVAELLFFLLSLLSSMFEAQLVHTYLLNSRIPVLVPFPPSFPCQNVDISHCPFLLFPKVYQRCTKALAGSEHGKQLFFHSFKI